MNLKRFWGEWGWDDSKITTDQSKHSHVRFIFDQARMISWHETVWKYCDFNSFSKFYACICHYQRLSLNFIYFTNITKQVIQLILIMLVGTDVCVRIVFVWEETGIPGGNPPVWLGDHMTISHADPGYQTRVAAVRGECVNTAPVRQCIGIDSVVLSSLLAKYHEFVWNFQLLSFERNHFRFKFKVWLKCDFYWWKK